MFYATLDTLHDTRIAERAHIAAFDTREQAVSYLLGAFDAAHWDHASAVIESGHFGDCWIAVHAAPGETERYFAPFSRDQLHIAAPGQHPGGRAWWIEPREEVLVVAAINERG